MQEECNDRVQGEEEEEKVPTTNASHIPPPSPTSPISPTRVLKPHLTRDVLGFVVANQEAYKRWSGSADQIKLHEKVAECGGWGGYLWTRQAEDLEWYDDDTYYQGLQWIAKQDKVLADKLPSAVASFKELNRDLPRTFPQHILEDTLRSTCQDLIQAYILRNRQVGYCQGMNYIAGILGRIMPVEKAFWLFTYVVEVIVPDYYRGLQGVVVDLKVLEAMLQHLEPALWEHLNKVGLTCGLAFTQYLVCLFSLGMPPEAVLQLWQVIFKALNPRVKLLRLTCSLMRLLKADLLSAPDLDTAIAVFAEGSSSLYNAQRLVDVSSVTEESLSDEWIISQRESFSTSVRESQAHIERLEFIQNAKLTRVLIKQVKAAWGGAMNDTITQAQLEKLIGDTGITPDISSALDWGEREVTFREMILTMVLLQEGSKEELLKTATDVMEDGENSEIGVARIASVRSRVSLALSASGGMDEKDEEEKEQAELRSKRPYLIPDTDVLTCYLCEREFKWFRRRHHCRACGNVVCSTCSPTKAPILVLGYPAPVRICRSCEVHLHVSPEEEEEEEEEDPSSPKNDFTSPFSVDTDSEVLEGNIEPDLILKE
eukprot:TRINITY_DN2231_c7_g1_i1.p1 TRINITY_DN2231_c7_g1~~TRINITY_DN2231_c7_g1_i1.p1  ORF type:complete len:599 (+),score=133.42 TRINITY_DN2231_c7_g1_i1:77-1873(+)